MSKHHEFIYFQGPCDRQCHRVTKHKHHKDDPLDGTVQHRHRLPSMTFPNRGGEYSDLMSVAELMHRLSQIPPTARISLEGWELIAFHNDLSATIAHAYDPSFEHFDRQHTITGVSR